MIDKFDGEYRFLSNFYPASVKVNGLGATYPTVEHAFQAAKTLNYGDRLTICSAPTPGAAKRMGRRLDLRPEWEIIKIDVMRGLLEQKFAGPSGMRSRLIRTQPNELIEGNTWGDTFWGVCNGVGQNHLGKLLMEIRDA